MCMTLPEVDNRYLKSGEKNLSMNKIYTIFHDFRWSKYVYCTRDDECQLVSVTFSD